MGSEIVECWHVTVMEGGKGGLGVFEIPTGKMVHHFSYADLLFIVFNKAA